jgi:ATP-binding cassette, subfamily C, bacterial LapB
MSVVSDTVIEAYSPSPDERGGPLLICLILIARAQGLATTADALLAGLPLVNGRLTPSLFERACKRVGLVSRVAKRSLTELNRALFPVILLLQDQGACLLTAIDVENENCDLVFPEFPDTSVRVSIVELQTKYTGQVIYARPQDQLRINVTAIDKSPKTHWFWSVIQAHKHLYRDVILAALMINIFALATPLFVMNIYDRVVPNQATDTLWILALGLFVVTSIDFLLRMMRTYFVDLAASRMDVTLSATIMEKVLGINMSARPDSVGSFASGLQSFESLRSFISSATLLSLVDLPFVLLFLLVILIISWPLVFPVLFCILGIVLYTAVVQQKMKVLSESSMQASAQRNSILVESLTTLETLKMLGAEGRMQAFWERATLLLSNISVKMRLLSASVNSGSLWLQQVSSISILIVGVYLIIDAKLTQGGLVASYMLSARIMGPVSQAAALLMQYHQATSSLGALDNIMAKPVERPQDRTWISRSHLQGAIEFKQVFFRYPNEEHDVLRGVSFNIKAGERIAILGRNGSAKTTIEKLIAGLYQPTSGTILIDGIDIRQIDPAELRRNLGYVPQDIALFQGSLRDNIVMGATSVSDDTLLKVIRVSGLTECVNQHPQGLAMPVGEQGRALSGGQRQCVAIARALVNDPAILLFDEPTGAMDHSNEEEFKRHIAQFAAGKTMIVITHRTSLLELVNRIIVMDAGKIVADGVKDQVVEALRQGRIGRAQ